MPIESTAVLSDEFIASNIGFWRAPEIDSAMKLRSEKWW